MNKKLGDPPAPRVVNILELPAGGVDGGLSGWSSVRRPGSEDPNWRQWKFLNRCPMVGKLCMWLDVTKMYCGTLLPPERIFWADK